MLQAAGERVVHGISNRLLRASDVFYEVALIVLDNEIKCTKCDREVKLFNSVTVIRGSAVILRSSRPSSARDAHLSSPNTRAYTSPPPASFHPNHYIYATFPSSQHQRRATRTPCTSSPLTPQRTLTTSATASRSRHAYSSKLPVELLPIS